MYFPPDATFNLMYYPYYGKKAQVRLPPIGEHTSAKAKQAQTEFAIFLKFVLVIQWFSGHREDQASIGLQTQSAARQQC